MQLRRLAAWSVRRFEDRHDELMRMIAEYNAIIASETRQREIISEELGEIVNRYGDERRTQIMYGYNGDMSMEDLIPEEEVVVTITRGGYIKRTRSDQYRSQHRGGKGIKGASLRGDDVVEHFFVTTTHSWILSSRIWVACTVRRVTSCRKPVVTRRVSTLRTCWSSRAASILLRSWS